MNNVEKNVVVEIEYVWVFVGRGRNPFPSGVFIELHQAEEWIEYRRLTGTLTQYPVNIGVYDWAISRQYFLPKRVEQESPDFIGDFSSAYQQHYHYKDGVKTSTL